MLGWCRPRDFACSGNTCPDRPLAARPPRFYAHGGRQTAGKRSSVRPRRRPTFIPLGRCPHASDRLNSAHMERNRFGWKIFGILVASAVGIFVLWWVVDRALFRFGAIAGLIFAFLLVGLIFYLLDRRKIKESEDLIAERQPFDPDPNVRR